MAAAPHRVHNFSAGPASLPLEVLQQAQAEFLDWHGTGMSVMEMSHRSKAYESIIAKTQQDLRALLNLPANYKVLFLQGGAYGAFASIPMNLLKGSSGKADYIVTGTWSQTAVKEAKKYCQVNVAATAEATKFTTIPERSTWNLTPGAAYVHFTSNETIHGVEFPMEAPEVPEGTVLVCDMSSDFLSRPIPDINKYGVIYAGAQKNAGPAGLAIVIVREDLLGRTIDTCPQIWNWADQAKNDSMLNTPPTYTIYMCGLYFAWMLRQGGLAAMQANARARATLLYDCIAQSNGYYTVPVAPACRSLMNIPYRILGTCAELEDKFVKEAEKAGLTTLKGHRSVGGLRASFYNACTMESVQALVAFMRDFQAKNPTAPEPKPAAAPAPAAH
ncbi:Phosphoserine transaminase [Paratrimastix pyriformis]|uniref:Phosphoserine aminotransferase n=1 Tax=Paratrimastix pyriformis TaxID=342808 RepID=A0ABQ8URU9_9EUKA|nr:Phosphoserine transaminase [Paratrimastix pyriformis]